MRDAGALLRRRLADARTGSAPGRSRGRAWSSSRSRPARRPASSSGDGGVVTYVPGARTAGRGRARPVRRERRRARGRHVLARRRARAAGHLGPQRARHGSRAALGSRRDPRSAGRGWSARARCWCTSTTPTRSCSRTRRSASRSSGRASKSPTMASRSSCERAVRRAPARAGRALPPPAPLPPAHGRRRAHARGTAALGREPLLLPEVHPAQGRGDPVQLRRGRGPARVDPAHHRPRRHGRRQRAASSRGCGSARRSASRATSCSRSAASCPRCATRSTPT